MKLTFKRGLDNVKTNQRAKYLGQRSFSSNVIVWTHRHNRPTARPGRPNGQWNMSNTHRYT